jgi:hypothetical protein
MTSSEFFRSMAEREGRTIRVWLHDRTNVTGVLETVSADSLLLRDRRGNQRILPIGQVAAWEDGTPLEQAAAMARPRKG